MSQYWTCPTTRAFTLLVAECKTIISLLFTDLRTGLPVVHTNYYQCSKVPDKVQGNKKKSKRLKSIINLRLNNGMVNCTTKQMFSLFFQRREHFPEAVDDTSAPPKKSHELYSIKNLNKGLRNRIVNYHYRTGILKTNVVVVPDREAKHDHNVVVLPVYINKQLGKCTGFHGQH